MTICTTIFFSFMGSPGHYSHCSLSLGALAIGPVCLFDEEPCSLVLLCSLMVQKVIQKCVVGNQPNCSSNQWRSRELILGS